MNTDTIFKKYQFEPGEIKLIPFGKISIKVQREKSGWFVRNYDQNENNESNDDKGDYFRTGESNSLFIAPELPGKPLVFKGNKLALLPYEKLDFYIKIPLILQIYRTSKKPENLIKEITHTRLSDTWFGEPDNGEIALNSGSEYFLDLDKITCDDFEAICPVSVYNNAGNILELQRVIIRVENLSLYLKNTKLITSQVKLEYKGKEILSSANYVTTKNIHGEKTQLLVKPRTEQGSNALKINFLFIRNIYKNM